MIAQKFDTEKVRMELLDPYAIEGLAKVLTFGANKYAANNWRGGLNYTRIIGAIKRHLIAIEKGEDTDPESGLPHIDHLGCEWMFLSFFMKHRQDLDDRWLTDAQKKYNSLVSMSITDPNSRTQPSTQYLMPESYKQVLKEE